MRKEYLVLVQTCLAQERHILFHCGFHAKQYRSQTIIGNYQRESSGAGFVFLMQRLSAHLICVMWESTNTNQIWAWMCKENSALGTKWSRQWLRKLEDGWCARMGGPAEITLEHGGEPCGEASWNAVNTFHTPRAWKQHAWGFHLHLDENGPPQEEIKPFLTPPSLATSRPPVMCPVNGLWVYSTAGSPQHNHK